VQTIERSDVFECAFANFELSLVTTAVSKVTNGLGGITQIYAVVASLAYVAFRLSDPRWRATIETVFPDSKPLPMGTSVGF
jgi:hypothetical protein